MRPLLLLFSLGASSIAHAGGFELTQQSAIAGGTAHAGSARPDDPSLAWANPSMLADGRGLSMAFGAHLATSAIHSASLESAPGEPWSATTTNGVSVPPFAHLGYSHANWATSVSFNAAFASTVRWPDDWEQRFDVLRSQPRFFCVQPAFSYRFGPVRASFGPHVDFGTLDVIKATNHVGEEGSAHLLLGGTGWGAHGSLTIEVHPSVYLVGTYKSRTGLSLHGDADFDVPAAFATTLPDQGVRARWVLPDRFGLGVHAGVGPVRLLGDLSYTTWSVNQQLVFEFEESDTTDSITVDYRWRDSAAARVGVEGDVGRFTLRGGVYVDGLFGAPPPAETLSPSSPDSTRIGATLGAGVVLTPQVRIDAYAEHMRLLHRESSSPDAPQASYRGEATVAGLQLSMRFFDPTHTPTVRVATRANASDTPPG